MFQILVTQKLLQELMSVVLLLGFDQTEEKKFHDWVGHLVLLAQSSVLMMPR